jgi:uncharacterized protein with von Willebrand factor type A (vWA) domain
VFIDFLYHLRTWGIRVTATEWLTLMQALTLGCARADLHAFYTLGRSLCVKNEALFDVWDQAFASFFEGLDQQFALDDEILEWLQNPILPREITDEERARMSHWDLDKLREEFEKRLREQKERHDGGNHWVGTGGTSPFGSGGTNAAGIRLGAGGGKTAAQVAMERRYANLRTDRVLDTRDMATALRRLRRLARDGAQTELDIDRTVDKTSREAGDITLVFGPERKNRLKLLLLVDVGGSMDPHAELCERLFSAAHAATHFKAFEARYFHNCVYDKVWSNMSLLQGEPTRDLLHRVDETWRLLIIGDAYMHPYELLQTGGAIDYRTNNAETGLVWLEKLRQRMPNSVWVNPEGPNIWDAPSARVIRGVFPMFRLSIDGLTDAFEVLRGRRRNAADLPPTPAPVMR